MAILCIWQIGWAVNLVPPIGLPSPLEIAIALWQLVHSGELWIHLEATLPRLGLGWLLGAAIAFAVAVASRHWSAARATASMVSAIMAWVPAIALLPLFIIWLGAGEGAIVATVALASFLSAIGAHAPDGDGRSFQAPGITERLRRSLPAAIAVLVAAEMIQGAFGLGALIFSAAELYRSDQIVAGCIVLAALGLGLSTLLRIGTGITGGEGQAGGESR